MWTSSWASVCSPLSSSSATAQWRRRETASHCSSSSAWRSSSSTGSGLPTWSTARGRVRPPRRWGDVLVGVWSDHLVFRCATLAGFSQSPISFSWCQLCCSIEHSARRNRTTGRPRMKRRQKVWCDFYNLQLKPGLGSGNLRNDSLSLVVPKFPNC